LSRNISYIQYQVEYYFKVEKWCNSPDLIFSKINFWNFVRIVLSVWLGCVHLKNLPSQKPLVEFTQSKIHMVILTILKKRSKLWHS
jgi:hypothetical protein